MTAETPPSNRSRMVGAAAAVVLAVGILAGGYFYVGRGGGVAERPEPGTVLLSTRLEVPAAGAATRFRLRAPGRLEITLDLPAGASVRASLGPPRIPVAGQGDAPDAAKSVTWTAKSGDAPRVELLYAAGLYVLRLDPSDGAGGAPPPPSTPPTGTSWSVGVAVKSVASR